MKDSVNEEIRQKCSRGGGEKKSEKKFLVWNVAGGGTRQFAKSSGSDVAFRILQ
jgi:hypothetical protein